MRQDRAWDIEQETMWKVSDIDFLSGTASVYRWEYNEQTKRKEKVSNFQMRWGHFKPQIILMQSTGRNDKNGKEIYEDDRVLIEWDDGEQDTYTVMWSEWGFCCDNFALLPDPKQITIVGNIHEKGKENE
jgi:uncharacterized phage protein (TIGR01671 family)